MKSALVVLAVTLLATGCRWERQAETRLVAAVDAPPLWSDSESRRALAAEAPPDSGETLVVSGEVVETMNARDYTYMRISTKRGDVWTAVPKTDVRLGDRVTVNGQLTMENFQSKTLKRKFDRIIFGTLAGSEPILPDQPATVRNVSVV